MNLAEGCIGLMAMISQNLRVGETFVYAVLLSMVEKTDEYSTSRRRNTTLESSENWMCFQNWRWSIF